MSTLLEFLSRIDMATLVLLLAVNFLLLTVQLEERWKFLRGFWFTVTTAQVLLLIVASMAAV